MSKTQLLLFKKFDEAKEYCRINDIEIRINTIKGLCNNNMIFIGWLVNP